MNVSHRFSLVGTMSTLAVPVVPQETHVNVTGVAHFLSSKSLAMHEDFAFHSITPIGYQQCSVSQCMGLRSEQRVVCRLATARRYGALHRALKLDHV